MKRLKLEMVCEVPPHAEALDVAFKWFERQRQSVALQLLHLQGITDLVAMKSFDSFRLSEIPLFFFWFRIIGILL